MAWIVSLNNTSKSTPTSLPFFPASLLLFFLQLALFFLASGGGSMGSRGSGASSFTRSGRWNLLRETRSGVATLMLFVEICELLHEIHALSCAAARVGWWHDESCAGQSVVAGGPSPSCAGGRSCGDSQRTLPFLMRGGRSEARLTGMAGAI